MRLDAARSMISDESGHFDAREAVPESPSALLKLQSLPTQKVSRVINLIDELNLQAGEMLDLSIRICSWLEALHDDHIKYHIDAAQTEEDRSSLVAWTIDAERLRQCGNLLKEIDV